MNSYGGKSKTIGGYTVEKRLGAGSFATVYKGVRQNQANADSNDVDVVAIKAISRKGKKLTPKVIENLDLEIAILKSYRHPNIVALHNVQKTERHFYLFLEFCGGGDVQQLIRTRKKKRLSERLTRRLIRDLTSGLKFLWGQHVMHRDIKPQNLLLTGPLPLDEVDDECNSPPDEQKRKEINFPTARFALKIADFGFARPLETASLAETLCGSPLYMAPEILEGHKYDAKADLWSVGTVLYEMIAGRPPFMGDNHIHLLRNIQTKSLRMPEGIKVSNECVNLMRLLLNRKPNQRADFQSFFEASKAFVGLGCEGNPLIIDSTQLQRQTLNQIKNVAESSGSHEASNEKDNFSNLHTQFLENNITNSVSDPSSNNDSSVVKVTNQNTFIAPKVFANDQPRNLATPPTPATPINLINPTIELSCSSKINNQNHQNQQLQQHNNAKTMNRTNFTDCRKFVPLAPSPPGPKPMNKPESICGPLSQQFHLDGNNFHLSPNNNVFHQPLSHHYQIKQPQTGRIQLQQRHQHKRKTESSLFAESDSEFVMVEYRNTSSTHTLLNHSSTDVSSKPSSSIQSLSIRNDKVITPSLSGSPSRGAPGCSPIRPTVNNSRRSSIFNATNGILGTSPENGKDLVAMMIAPKFYENARHNSGLHGFRRIAFIRSSELLTKADISLIVAMLATAEDVGRRAVCVAQIGDSRSFVAMRVDLDNSPELTPLPICQTESTNNLDRQYESTDKKLSVDNEMSTDEMCFNDSMQLKSKRKVLEKIPMDDNENDDEMPFAVIASDTEFPVVSVKMKKTPGSVCSIGISNSKSSMKLCRFCEALSCYLKALSLMKSALNALQLLMDKFGNDADRIHRENDTVFLLMNRCNSSLHWLSCQFTGVLERADACNVEMSKMSSVTQPGAISSAEELIYDHALMCGRDGAVKQLLGQHEAAKACYRSAGLLVEVLLMEPRVGDRDRKILNEYVEGFCQRIKEISVLMTSQLHSSVAPSKENEGSAVVGLVGEVIQSKKENCRPSTQFYPHRMFSAQLTQQLAMEKRP